MYRVEFCTVKNGNYTPTTVHDELSLFLVNPVLVRTINKSGCFTFSITPDNPGYAELLERMTEVYIYKNNELLWTGCVLGYKTNLYGIKEVTCEGVLGYLNDISFSVPPASNTTMYDFFGRFIFRFNDELSKILGDGWIGRQKRLNSFPSLSLDTPDVIVLNPSFKDPYESGMEKITGKVIERFGGMLTAKKTSPMGDIELDYRQSLTKSCGQKIVFADNLVDYMEETSYNDIYNVIIPLGKNKGTSFKWDYVTIESVNSGENYIANAASVKQFGVIARVVHWNDVESPAELLKLAKRELAGNLVGEVSISVSAVDQEMTGVDVEAFDIGLLVTVQIEPLGIERELLITSITNYLSEPEKDTYTLGKAPSTSTSYTSGGSTGSSGGSDGEALEDTGWNTATIASGFRAYNGTTSNTPQYRRIGKQVKIRGVLQPTAAISASTTAKAMFTLPEGFKPSKQEYKLCQGSIKNTWLLTIFSNGEVGISRYGTTASAEISTSAWLPFEHEFYVD